MLAKLLQVRTLCLPMITPCRQVAEGVASEMAVNVSELLDLVEPASISFDEQGRGAFALRGPGGLQLPLHGSPDSVRSPGKASTRWRTCAAPVMLSSTRSPLHRARSAFHDGDNSTFKARRW